MNELSPDVTEDIESLDAVAQTAPEQEATPEPESEDAAVSTEDSQDGEPSRAERRIQQLVGDKKSAMEFATLQKEEADRVRAELADLKKEKETPAKLTIEDFDYDEDAYNASQLDQQQATNDRKIEEGIAKALESRTQAQQAETVEAEWGNKVNTFKAANADFDDVISNVPATKEMADIIKADENGPELAYHLGKNPEEAQRIANLPQSQQGYAMGKVAASLSKPVVKQKTVTQAPDTMSAVNGQQPTSSDADLSIEDYMLKRRKQQTEGRR